MNSRQNNIKCLDGIAEESTPVDKYPFWGSSRMVYTICAFLAMVVHLCMRNTINFVILCMVKPDSERIGFNRSLEHKEHYSNCYTVDENVNSDTTIERVGL